MLRLCLAAGLGLATAAAAQAPLPMPAFVTTHVAAATRGFWFTCPVPCVITGLQAPNEAAQPNQVVEVLDFGTTPLPQFPATATAVAQLFYDNSVPAGTRVDTGIVLQAGRVYGIFGCCNDAQGSATTYTSYGDGPFSTDVLGVPVTVERLLTQTGIASNGGNQPCSAASGRIGRVLVDIEQLPGLYAQFTPDVTSGPSPLLVNFTDTSYTNDPGGVTSWAWDFENDGFVDSTLQNPSHTYTNCGEWDCSLTVTDATNPPSTRLVNIELDRVTPSFTVSLLTPPNVWQFTDTSTLTPATWSWDFEDDGTVDSTLQHPTWTSPTSCVHTTVRLDVSLNCRNASLVQPTFLAPSSFLGETGGGNALSSPTSVGNYFDVEITRIGGVAICGLTVAPYSVAGPFDVSVYGTEDTHVGKEGVATAWRLLGTGTGVSAGGGYAPPTLAEVALDQPFLLPEGDYGMAVFLSSPTGMGIAYTDGPAGPYVGADLTIHPGGTGSASVSELGPIAFSPRLWNGGFFYSWCDLTGEAGTGFFGTGCPGALGTPELDPGGTGPVIGTTWQLDITNVPNGLAVLVTGFNHTFSPLFGALPADASAFGAPGCWLRVSSEIADFLPTGSTTATWTLQVPNDPTLSCLPLFHQAAVLSPGANALGYVLSDARFSFIGQ